MLEPLADFQCWVGKYEVRPANAVPESDFMAECDLEPPNTPHLVQIGPATLRSPRRKALNYAVQLLLQTQMPKWREARYKWRVEFDERYRELSGTYWTPRDATSDSSMAAAARPIEFDKEELFNFQRIVTQIAR